MSNENNQESEKPSFLRPYWYPDSNFEDLPENMRLAIEGLVGPAYQEMVMGARDTLDQLTGISVVHLAHLEILDQLQLADELPTAAPEERQAKVASHVRLSGAKLRAMSFLLRLRKARGKSDPNTLPPQGPGDEPKS